jgi:DNA invertase Pin-like site-specific DNA recombinase
MVGILAELECSLIQERTKAGRSAALARGVKMALGGGGLAVFLEEVVPSLAQEHRKG